jgi:hypothetical protein
MSKNIAIAVLVATSRTLILYAAAARRARKASKPFCHGISRAGRAS